MLHKGRDLCHHCIPSVHPIEGAQLTFVEKIKIYIEDEA